MAGHEHLHCVHGEWMTLREVCAALGITMSALRHWRERHRGMDGKPGLVEEAWDYYKAKAAGEIPETRGKRPVMYRYKGGLASIPEVAKRTGIEVHRIYNTMNDHQCGLEEAVKRIDALDKRRQVQWGTRQIMGIINSD